MTSTPRYPAPPAWIRRGAQILVDAADLEPDEQGHRPYEGEGELIAVVTHVGDPITGKRTAGPVWLRREGGGPEVAAPCGVLRPDSRTPGDEATAAAEKAAGA